MIGIAEYKEDTIEIALVKENGSLLCFRFDKNHVFRNINPYFISKDMKFGVLYDAITGNNEYYISKVKILGKEQIIKLDKSV